MHGTLEWRSERIEREEGEINYEAHGPKDSFVIFEGPNAKADCELFMRAVNGDTELTRLREALITLRSFGCPVCNGDCSAANPPVMSCPIQITEEALKEHGK